MDGGDQLLVHTALSATVVGCWANGAAGDEDAVELFMDNSEVLTGDQLRHVLNASLGEELHGDPQGSQVKQVAAWKDTIATRDRDIVRDGKPCGLHGPHHG